MAGTHPVCTGSMMPLTMSSQTPVTGSKGAISCSRIFPPPLTNQVNSTFAGATRAVYAGAIRLTALIISALYSKQSCSCARGGSSAGTVGGHAQCCFSPISSCASGSLETPGKPKANKLRKDCPSALTGWLEPASHVVLMNQHLWDKEACERDQRTLAR